MRRTLRSPLVAVLAAAGAAACAAPASAGIWTEIPSGTAAEITAIEYQSPARFWFTTSAGEIWRRRADLSGFQLVRPASFQRLNDIEFQAGGNVGLAVGSGGVVLRSADGGASWSAVGGIVASNVGDGSGNKCTLNTPLRDVSFVRFAGDGRAWVGAEERQLVTSQPATAGNVGAAGTWTDANRKSPPVARDNCWVTQGGGFADMFVTPNPDVFYLATGTGADVVFSSSNLRNVPQTKPAGAANGFVLAGTIAGDPANPSRMWAVSPAPYGNSTAQYTEDGYATARWFDLLNEDAHPWPSTGPYDVDFAGGTVLAAGNAGFVIHSTNGRDFYWNGADGALAGQDWRAVALASATDGAIGGTNGKLAISAQANLTPDLIAPRGTISGPGGATAGQPVAFTLAATDEGGSGLNAGSFAWTATGLPGQSGTTVSYTFPSAGSYTVGATFADNAGNTGTATTSVFVRSAAVTPPPRPRTGTRRPGTGGSANPGPGPVSVPRASAVIVGRRVRVRVNGAVRLPRGARLRAVCRGRVGIALTKQVGRRQARLASARVGLAPSRGACRYTKVFFVPRSKVGQVRRLRLTVRFPGSRSLRAGRRTTQLVVTK